MPCPGDQLNQLVLLKKRGPPPLLRHACRAVKFMCRCQPERLRFKLEPQDVCPNLPGITLLQAHGPGKVLCVHGRALP